MYGTDYRLTDTPMASALQFPLKRKFSQLYSLRRTRNSWDRDLRLKAALGVPKEVFGLSQQFLGFLARSIEKGTNDHSRLS